MAKKTMAARMNKLRSKGYHTGWQSFNSQSFNSSRKAGLSVDLELIAKRRDETRHNTEEAYSLEQQFRLNAATPELVSAIAKAFRAQCVVSMYSSASEYSGGCVKLRHDYKCLPLLERKDMPPVLLYDFVEVIDGLVDYDEVIEEFPGLSYSQVNSALGFLRRLAQFNTAGVDIDEVESKYLSQDEELITALRDAINRGGDDHVLNAPEPNHG